MIKIKVQYDIILKNKRSSIRQNSMRTVSILIILVSLLEYARNFQFRSPEISPTVLTINTESTYQFTLHRQIDDGGAATAYNTEAVPASSSITITFPAEYTLDGSETCTSLLINFAISTSFGCDVNTVSNVITFTNTITTDTFISSVILQVGSVTNPIPALTTSPFVATIGTDVSATNSLASVTLQEADLASLSITFSPTTVNSTSSMIVQLLTTNTIPQDGSIRVTFPSALYWAQDLATTSHPIPIQGTLSCSAITNIAFTIACSGSSSTVTLTSLFSATVPAATTLKFTINNLHTPPTIQQVDMITVTTYYSSDSSANMLDTGTSTITGLTSHTMSLTITPTSTMVVNQLVGLNFQFVLQDTVTKDDVFEIRFPSGTTINFVTQVSFSFGISDGSYDSNTLTLTFNLGSSSPTRYAQYSASIVFLNFQAPPSTKATDTIQFAILNNGFEKMVGSSTVTAVPATYTATVSTLDTEINAQTSYHLTFTLADPITSSGYIEVTVPSQLSIASGYSVTLDGNSLEATPTFTNNAAIITITDLNTSAADINGQQVIIKIEGLIQPNSTQSISSFELDIFYSDEGDEVATATTSNTITTTPGTITSLSVSAGSLVTADDPVTYTFIYVTANALDSTGFIEVTVPTDSVTLHTGGTCTIQSITVPCTINSDTITASPNGNIAEGQTVTFTYSAMGNPSTTQQTGNFSVRTYNVDNQEVDVLDGGASISMTTPSSLLDASVSRSSKVNGITTTYVLTFKQSQILSSGAKAEIILPQGITVQGAITCNNQNSDALPCSATPQALTTKVLVELQVVNSQNYSYSITIQGITNPISFQPTSSIQITTLTTDEAHKFSTITTGLQITNEIASKFVSMNYTFSNQYLGEDSTLQISLEIQHQPEYLVVELAQSLGVGTITCHSDQFSPICSTSVNGSQTIVKVESGTGFPAVFSLELSGLTNPDAVSSQYTYVSSYSDTDFLISLDSNTIIFETVCTLPCKDCTSTLTECTSCYPSSLSTQIYLFDADCLSICPSGYYQNVNDLKCSQCQPPCGECDGEPTYCIACDTNTEYIYLNQTNTTSTCMSECPPFFYPDITQIPYLCTQCLVPCSQCTQLDTCTTCISGYFLYGATCVQVCPSDVTVEIGDECVDCSDECATCSGQIDNCTSCSNIAALYNGSCVLECPDDLIIKGGLCVACDSQCETCAVQTDNCTSCGVALPYFFDFDCLDECPDYYYPDPFDECQLCDGLGRGCENCSSPSVCLSCDVGYVLLNNNCLDYVPVGYLNISGEAKQCQGDCETCAVTLTNCTSCRNLSLHQNTCNDTCPTTTTSVNQICQPCQYPCLECDSQVTFCTSCYTNSSTYLFASSCVQAADCPDTTYANTATLQCEDCPDPCLNCNSSTECESCISGYYFRQQTLQCVDVCPVGMVGENKLCVQCTSPCEYCEITSTHCTSCISSYYYNQNTHECVDECASGLIPDNILMQCISCQSPCKTCENTTTTCLSCQTGTFLYLQQCVKVCPDGYYGSSNVCLQCVNDCTTCSSKTACLSCSVPLVLFSAQCLTDCPVTHSIVNDSVCQSCETVMIGCSNCSDNGECYQCYSPKIYFNTECLDDCPDGYVYVDFSCEVDNSTNDTLDDSLTSASVFPLPFTTFGGVLFIAGFLSKLQNSNTYLIGLSYALYGFLESTVLSYLFYRYYALGEKNYQEIMVLLLVIVLGAIAFLNFISFIAQTIVLMWDKKFSEWLGVCGNKTMFGIITVLSFLVNYKLKMAIFTKLFNFLCMRAQLQSIHKFRVFNIFSFFGLIPEAAALYVCFITLFKFTVGTDIFLVFIDAIVIVIINIILAILVSWKKEDFFTEVDDDDMVLNKRFNADGEEFSKEALDPIEYQDSYANDLGVYEALGKNARNINQDEEDQLEFSFSDQQSIEADTISKNASQTKEKKLRKTHVYFANQDQSSNPFRKAIIETQFEDHKKIPNEQNQKAENIFQRNQEEYDEEFSENKDIPVESLISGRKDLSSTNIIPQNKMQAPIVVGEGIGLKQHQLVDDIEEKIKQKQQQLDELKHQMSRKDQIKREEQKKRRQINKSSSDQDNSLSEEKQEVEIEKSSRQQRNAEQITQKQDKDQQTDKISQIQQKKLIQQKKYLEAQNHSITIKSSENQRDQEFDENEKKYNQIQLAYNKKAKILNEQVPHLEQTNKLNWFELKGNQSKAQVSSFQQNRNQDRTLKEKQIEDNKQIESSQSSFSKQQQLNQQEKKRIDLHKQEEKGLEQQQVIQQEQVFQEHQNTKALEVSIQQSQQNQIINQYNFQMQRDRPFTAQTKNLNRLIDHGINTVNHDQKTWRKDPYSYEQGKQGKQGKQEKSVERNTTNNFFTKEINKSGQEDDSGLQDSQQQVQVINQRPIQPIRKKGMNTHDALIDILHKVDQEKGRKGNKTMNHEILSEREGSDQLKFASYDEEFQKGRKTMYHAGKRQLENQTIAKNIKHKHYSFQQKQLHKSGEESQGQDLEDQALRKQRTQQKIFNKPPLRKFASKDLSSENFDDMDFREIPLNKNIRVRNKEEYIEKDRIRSKPKVVRSSRGKTVNSGVYDSIDSKLGNTGLNMINPRQKNGSIEGGELNEYYKREDRLERQDSKDRGGSKSRKKKSLNKDHSFEDKRMKQLQKIYLAKQ